MAVTLTAVGTSGWRSRAIRAGRSRGGDPRGQADGEVRL